MPFLKTQRSNDRQNLTTAPPVALQGRAASCARAEVILECDRDFCDARGAPAHGTAPASIERTPTSKRRFQNCSGSLSTTIALMGLPSGGRHPTWSALG